MHIDMTRGRPIRCSKCGSTNAVHPANSRDIAIRCDDCGHSVLTREAQSRRDEREYGAFLGWKAEPADKDPTF